MGVVRVVVVSDDGGGYGWGKALLCNEGFRQHGAGQAPDRGRVKHQIRESKHSADQQIERVAENPTLMQLCPKGVSAVFSSRCIGYYGALSTSFGLVIHRQGCLESC